MKEEKEHKVRDLLIIVIVFIIMIFILISYNNYMWVNNNCYNSLINASSEIIARCGNNGVYP